MNYKLNKKEKHEKKEPFLVSIKRLGPLMKDENKNLIITLIAVLISSLSSLIAPIVI
jgi:hypothetical protein